MRRILIGAVLGAVCVAPFAAPPDDSLARMADDVESAYAQQMAPRETANPQYVFNPPDTSTPGASTTGAASAKAAIGQAAAAGSNFSTALTGARNAADLWDASNLLDKATDPNYEPDLSGEGAPELPASLCGASYDCNACYASVFQSLDASRLNLEKLRIAGRATSDLVSKSYALGDGLAGVTGVAALEWQRQRAGIGKTFEHFKGTYDSKYEGMMRGLKDVMDRWNACEGQYGERDWYARFGFLYYQFMRDKYKRNF